MEPEQGGRRSGWDPMTTAQSWGRGAAGPPPRALEEAHRRQPRAARRTAPPWETRVPTQTFPGQHGLPWEGWQEPGSPPSTGGAQGPGVPATTPATLPTAPELTSLPNTACPYGAWGCRLRHLRGPSRGHRCLPHPDPRRLGRDSLLAAEATERRRAGPIWGAQAAGPQLWASSPGTRLASPGLCPTGRAGWGLGSTPSCPLLPFAPKFHPATPSEHAARQLFLITRHLGTAAQHTFPPPATRDLSGDPGVSAPHDRAASETRVPPALPNRLLITLLNPDSNTCRETPLGACSTQHPRWQLLSTGRVFSQAPHDLLSNSPGSAARMEGGVPPCICQLRL